MPPCGPHQYCSRLPRPHTHRPIPLATIPFAWRSARRRCLHPGDRTAPMNVSPCVTSCAQGRTSQVVRRDGHAGAHRHATRGSSWFRTEHAQRLPVNRVDLSLWIGPSLWRIAAGLSSWRARSACRSGSKRGSSDQRFFSEVPLPISDRLTRFYFKALIGWSQARRALVPAPNAREKYVQLTMVVGPLKDKGQTEQFLGSENEQPQSAGPRG